MAFVAGVVNAVGVVFFLVPISIVDGGLSGTSFLLSRFTALPLGAYIFILNLPFFLIGIRKQGITFMIYSMISVATYAICAFLFQNVFDFANAVRDNLGCLRRFDIGFGQRSDDKKRRRDGRRRSDGGAIRKTNRVDRRTVRYGVQRYSIYSRLFFTFGYAHRSLFHFGVCDRT